MLDRLRHSFITLFKREQEQEKRLAELGGMIEILNRALADDKRDFNQLVILHAEADTAYERHLGCLRTQIGALEAEKKDLQEKNKQGGLAWEEDQRVIASLRLQQKQDYSTITDLKDTLAAEQALLDDLREPKPRGDIVLAPGQILHQEALDWAMVQLARRDFDLLLVACGVKSIEVVSLPDARFPSGAGATVWARTGAILLADTPWMPGALVWTIVHEAVHIWQSNNRDTMPLNANKDEFMAYLVEWAIALMMFPGYNVFAEIPPARGLALKDWE